MPPRRSGRVAAAAEQRAWAFPQLPLPLALRIFSLLPADQRLRAAEVSRGWRATVAMPALWTRLDLSPASGVVQRNLAALLRAAVARAGDALIVINLSGTSIRTDVVHAALRSASRVEEVDLRDTRSIGVVALAALLAAAPQLRVCHADVYCDLAGAVALFEARALFAPLRIHALDLRGADGTLPPDLALALADARLQPDLAHVDLHFADLRAPAAFDAVADAVVARQRLCQLRLFDCRLSPAVAPALARALRGGALTELDIFKCNGQFVDESSAAVLCDALRADSTLTSLRLHDCNAPPLAAPAVAAILGGLVAHRSLRVLNLSFTRLEMDAAACAALGALIAADAPALAQLYMQLCGLGEAGLGALLDALPSNNHLRVLSIRNNDVPAGFMAAHLLPAVRGNTSLRDLRADADAREDEDDKRARQEAQRIIAAR